MILLNFQLSNFAYFASFGWANPPPPPHPHPIPSISLGTIPFYIAAELFPQECRSLGQSLVSFIALAISFCFNLLILPSYDAIGVWSFFPLFTLPQICSLTFLWLYLPETR
jgi:hypothetical protein